jgi:large subunit ribosomal protein L10
MNREQKSATIEQIAAQIEGSEAIFAIDYRGISVPQAAELRTKLSEADASFRVVKNRLTKLAAERAGEERLAELLQGPTALTFVRGDTAMAAKAIATFSREHDVLAFKGGYMDDLSLDQERFKSIARLPARDVLNGQLAGLVASPLTGVVRGLGSMISGLAMQLGQIAEQGLLGGEAPAEAPAPEPAPEADSAEEESPTEAAAESPPAEEQGASQSEDESPTEEAVGEDTTSDQDESKEEE